MTARDEMIRLTARSVRNFAVSFAVSAVVAGWLCDSARPGLAVACGVISAACAVAAVVTLIAGAISAEREDK